MSLPYRARVNERTLLNLPGFHDGAYVYAFVEDTSARELQRYPDCEPDCECCPRNFEPRMTLEMSDCDRRISLEFDIDTDEGRENSLHKLETLLTAIRVFREALEAEFEPYDARELQLKASREQD